MGEKRRHHFPKPAPKKALKPVKVVSERKNSPPASPPSPPFTPVVLIKCQFLASHISVDGVTKSATSIEPCLVIRNTGDHEAHDFQDFVASWRQFLGH
jgi:hypothetical protein